MAEADSRVLRRLGRLDWRNAGAVRACLSEVGVATAVRALDRAFRTHAGERFELLPLYGRLLLEQGEYAAALGLLDQAAAQEPSPELEALALSAIRHLHGPAAAVPRLQLALQGHVAGGALAAAAGGLLRIAEAGLRGWVGVGADLVLRGAVAAGSAEPVEVRDGAGLLLARAAPRPATGGLAGFQLRLRRCDRKALQVTCAGVELCGSGLGFLPEFGLDGRGTEAGGVVQGWVRLRWNPAGPLQCRLQDETGRELRLPVTAEPGGSGRQRFRLSLRQAGIRGSRITISALLPDGGAAALPDAPLWLRQAARRALPAVRAAAAAPRRRRPPADVVVPVYGGGAQALACIEAVLGTPGAGGRLIVVDDASPDAGFAAALERLALAHGFTLLRNPRNLGFVASVNRALALHPAHDAVLLNSDTRVFGGWLRRLRAAAYAAPDTGSATAWGSRAAIASYPAAADIAPEDAAQCDRLAAAVHRGITVDLPVGVGFCLYLRRDCLEQAGGFDQELFGPGYGEESDFCMRARRLGWRHVLAADVYVWHAGGGSFGGRRDALLQRGARLMRLRHPDYAALVGRFLERQPLAPLRRRLDEERLVGAAMPGVLLVTVALEGGVNRVVAQRRAHWRERGLAALVLSAAPDGKGYCLLRADAADLQDLRYRVPAELPVLLGLLRRLGLRHIEVHHFLGLHPGVVEGLLDTGIAYDVYVHDYVWICPRVSLVDGSGSYCGEPAVAVCERCIRRDGGELEPALTVRALRRRSARWLGGARRVVVPSEDTARRVGRYFPGLQVAVEPLQDAAAAAPDPAGAVRPARRRGVRVAVLGALNLHKGYAVLRDCARAAAAHAQPLEFVVVGHTRDDAALMRTGKAFVTGPYAEGEAWHLLQRERPNLIFVSSVCPETWSYTLTEALRAGLPIVAFDLGAIAERLRAAQRGVLVPLGTGTRELNELFLRLGAQRLRGPQGGVPKPDGGPDSRRRDGCGAAAPPTPDYGDAMTQATEALDSQGGLGALVKVLPLPAGIYVFSAAGPEQKSEVGNFPVPALHVALGPGVTAQQVEFVAPDGAGTWLFASSGILIAKVKAPGATLVLTSVRGEGGQTLAIKIQRLGGPDEAAAVAAAAAPPPASADTRAPAEARAADGLRLRINTHVRSRGDLSFVGVPWAGRVASGLWLEAFSLAPLEALSAHDLEYKGLTASGFETPWLSDEASCGTRGMAVPLVGFAVRLREGGGGGSYDCEYSGYFRSGTIVGPLRNGAPCRSTQANDPLEGIQVRLTERKRAGRNLPGDKAAASGKAGGPAFSKLREEAAATIAGAPGRGKAGQSASKPRPSGKAGKARAKGKPQAVRAGSRTPRKV